MQVRHLSLLYPPLCAEKRWNSPRAINPWNRGAVGCDGVVARTGSLRYFCKAGTEVCRSLLAQKIDVL